MFDNNNFLVPVALSLFLLLSYLYYIHGSHGKNVLPEGILNGEDNIWVGDGDTDLLIGLKHGFCGL